MAGEGSVAGKDGIERKHRCTVLLKLLEDLEDLPINCLEHELLRVPSARTTILRPV